MLPNIVLIGFMGCGKSSVGRRLAALTGHRFIDSDEMVAQSEGCSIAEIFALGGEEEFRNAEEKVLAGLVGVAGVVLATGGGAILREPNRAAMKSIGAVAWLDADPDSLFERASRSHRRPLLQTKDPRKTFDHLLALRREIYEATADFRVDSTGLGHDQVAQTILDRTMRHRAGSAPGQ
ncbi:MAG: shikimate kinase [Verrucomicrobiae bacterium]